MKKILLIISYVLINSTLKAQYFSPESYVLQYLEAGKMSVGTTSGFGVLKEKTVTEKEYPSGKMADPFSDTIGNETRLKNFLSLSAKASSENNYKVALEYAIVAGRLAQKNNFVPGWELSEFMQTAVFYRMQSYKNVVLHEVRSPSNSELAFQTGYLIASSFLKMGEYDNCIESIQKTATASHISDYDLLQLIKLKTMAFEAQKNFDAALNTTYSADSLLQALGSKTFAQSTNPYLNYSSLTTSNYSEKIIAEKVIAKNNTGFLLLKKGKNADAKATFEEALKVARQSKLNDLALQVTKNLGLNSTLLGQFDEADNYYASALKLSENEKESVLSAEILCLRGKNRYLSNNMAKATDYCKASVALAEMDRNYKQLSQSYAVLAEINAYVGDIQKATFYSKLSEESAGRAISQLTANNAETKANAIREEVLYDVFTSEKAELELIQYKLEATRRFQELEIIKRENQIKESNLTAQKLESEKAQQALIMVQRELQTLNQLKELEQIKKDRAINILENKNNQTKIRLLNKQRKFDVQVKKQREKDARMARARERNLRIFLFVALIVLSLIGFLLYRNVINGRAIKSANLKLEDLTTNLQSTNHTLESTLAEVNNKNEIIELKNHQILESITYAKRIQEASLPKLDEIAAVSSDGFVINKPKDIISGDFYIVSTVKTPDGSEQNIYIVGDCTGHGVPGAMLSLLCSNLVRQSIGPSAANNPAWLLSDVNQRLRNFFRNKDDDSFKDGMDIACCILDKSAGKLYFAGAGRPLIHVNKNEVIELKGEKHHIGFSSSHFDFTNIELNVKPGDIIYLFTDGYTDQFNGLTRKRFMTKNLKELLATIRDEPMKKQALKLDEAFENWKGDYMQMDDVCVLGIKI